MTTNVIVARSSAAKKYDSLDDNVDQKVFDLTTVSVKVDKAATIKEFENRKLMRDYCEDTIRKNITDRIHYYI